MRLARFVVAPPREVQLERIDRRFEAMMRHGALEEAWALIGIDPSLPAEWIDLGAPPRRDPTPGAFWTLGRRVARAVRGDFGLVQIGRAHV